MAIKKKKKKEELDASLMGWHLPSAIVPVMSAPVSGLRKLPSAPAFLQWSWRYMPAPGGTSDVHVPEGPPPLARQFVQAWGFYGLAGLADPKNFAEASAWSRILGIPYYGGYLVAGAVGFFVTGLVLTAIDPLHKWGGGLDETAFYERRVTNAVRKQEWGAGNSEWQTKAEARYGWGM